MNYMKKVFLVLFFWMFIFSVNAQIINKERINDNLFKNDSTKFNSEVQIKLDGKTTYTDFKIISIHNDTTVVDTTLTLNKDFLFNYIRKDNFELLPFHNQGQTFNNLGYNFENHSIFPVIGFSSKQFNYYKIEDVLFYYVPTPTSELMYRTGLEQGQVLDVFVTMNTSKQFNFSFAYKGLRSLGKYRNSLSSHGNFRTTFNYHSKNNAYMARGHFSSFDLLNIENGGLTPESIDFFENNDPNYIDRARLEVNFGDAENLFEGKRYYLEQQITLYSKKSKIEKQNTIVLEKIQKYNSVINEIAFLKKDTVASPKKAKIGTLPKSPRLTKKLPLKKKDSIIKSDSIAVNNIVKIDSLTKKLPLKKKNSIIKLDSIAINNIVKIDSLLKVASEIKIDSTQLLLIDENSLFDVKFGHTFLYETKHYRFTQSAANSIFGDAFEQNIADHTSYQKMNNEVYLQLKAPYLGTLKAKANYFKYNYHYNSILYYNNSQTVSDKLKGNAISVGADWKTKFRKLHLNAAASSIITGDLTGTSIKASVAFKKDSIYSFKGFAELTSTTPNFNKLLFQSDYINYNWQNNFENEELKNIGVEFKLNKWGSIKASYNLVDKYVYFNENSAPVQATETLNYIKVKAHQFFTFRNFTIDNTVMYQTVSKGDSFFKVPEIVTRNTLYYSNYLFKGKPMYLQTGVTFKYFTAFNANAYNPLLSEFVLQNETEIGNFPILDFFVNIQVRRTRLFLKVENFTASFTGRNYYSAPNYPYRDLTVRFGLVWNFFI